MLQTVGGMSYDQSVALQDVLSSVGSMSYDKAETLCISVCVDHDDSEHLLLELPNCCRFLARWKTCFGNLAAEKRTIFKNDAVLLEGFFENSCGCRRRHETATAAAGGGGPIAPLRRSTRPVGGISSGASVIMVADEEEEVDWRHLHREQHESRTGKVLVLGDSIGT
jgi:hypothetical protein